MKNIFAVAPVLLFSWLATAKPLFQAGLSSRSRGMGGTSIAYARGTDALFYNAAALARVEGYSFKIIDAHVGISKNSQRLFDQFQNRDQNLTPDALEHLYGNTFFLETSAQSGMVLPFFGFGVYSYNQTLEAFNNPVFPTFDVSLVSEYGDLVALAFPISEKTSVGITGRHAKRWSGSKQLLISDLIGTNDQDLIVSQLKNKGTGQAIDFSFLTSLPNDFDFGFVWKDVGNTRYSASEGEGPEQQEDNLAVGISKNLNLGLFEMTNAMEYKFIRQSEENISKKLHFGSELSFGLFDFRAGISQGYFSYGAGVDLWLFSVDAAAYTDEMGSVTGQNRNDRYQASISINLDLDQAFKMKNQFGKKRRLMQRR